MFSSRALGWATIVAFLAGLLASLALRPPGQPAAVPSVQPANARTAVRWRLPLSAPRSLPGYGETPLWWADTLQRASGGAFVVDLYDPGEIVPAFAITDAVRDRKVPAGYTWLGYDQGKIPAAALFGATPFGLEPWAYMGWWFFAGGRELGEEIFGKHGVKPIFCSISGPETAGWFRFPIRSATELQGLKIRFAGVGGKVMERVGASVTMLPSGEIFQALETGVIDATEFAQPISDQALGFARIAKYNYFPGWHQPFSATHLVVNIDVWNGLGDANQALVEGLCTAATARNLGLSEAQQGPVIAGLGALGVTASTLPEDVLLTIKQAADEVLNEEAAQDADFRAVLESQRAFQQVHAEWRRLAYLPMHATSVRGEALPPQPGSP